MHFKLKESSVILKKQNKAIPGGNIGGRKISVDTKLKLHELNRISAIHHQPRAQNMSFNGVAMI